MKREKEREGREMGNVRGGHNTQQVEGEKGRKNIEVKDKE